MFQHIHRPTPRNRKREAGAALLSVLALLGLGSTSLLTGSQLVEGVPVQPVEVEFTELADLAPPPPPPKLGVEDGQVLPQDAPPTVPDAPQPEPEPEPEPAVEDPRPEPQDAQAALDLPKGTPDGDALGDPNGEAGGVFGGEVGGIKDGVICGQGQDCSVGPKALHSSQVTVLRQVAPQYPAAARELGLEGQCAIRMFVDERGRVSDVGIEDCPVAFQEAAREAAFQWRFKPYKDAQGQRQASTFVLKLVFQLE